MGRIAEEGLLVAYGATEPQAGSDLAALDDQADAGRARTARSPATGSTGASSGSATAAWPISTRSWRNAPGGPILVRRRARRRRASRTGKPEDKHGIRASNTAALFLEDVFVPADRLVGGVEGKGLAQAQAVFGYTRLMVGGVRPGRRLGGAAARHPLLAAAHPGRRAAEPEAGLHAQADRAERVRLEAARAYIEWVAERHRRRRAGPRRPRARSPSILATEAGNKAAEDAIQALGGYGYTREYMVEKIKRDVRITTIYEGTSEIMEWTIARDRWQQHLKTRGAVLRRLGRAARAASARSRPNAAPAAAALALRALAVILERCRLDRLTRNQHVLFRLGELIA